MKRTILAIYLLIATCSARADMLLGGDIEVNAWQQSYTNNHADDGDKLTYSAEASLEHPLPLIPNIKLAQSSAKGNNYEFTKQDVTLYYEILDNDLISVDVGAGISRFTNGQLYHQDFTGYVPHLYGALEIGVPATPLFIYAKGTGISYSDHDMSDISAGLQYAIGMGLFDLEIQAGYRIQSLNFHGFDNLSNDLNTETKGPYVGINLDF